MDVPQIAGSDIVMAEVGGSLSKRNLRKQDIRAIVQDLLETADLPWMEDDDSVDDEHYINRALSDVVDHFNRYVAIDVDYFFRLTR